MTHKYKKPGANVIVHEDNQTQGNQENFAVQLMNRVRSGADVVRQNISNHYGLLAGIGIACGAAFYLFGTEHGRNMGTQIRKTVSSSIDTATDTVTDRFTKLKDATVDLVNKAISQEDQGEIGLRQSEIASSRLIRAVVQSSGRIM